MSKSIQKIAQNLIQSALESVDPYKLIKNNIRLKNSILSYKEKQVDLSEFENIYIHGAGKAAAPMAQAFEEILGEFSFSGTIVVKYDHSLPLKHIKCLEAGHPIPDENSLQATKEIVEIAQRASESDLVIFLLSGGGSALFELLPNNIKLEHLIEMNKILLASGATIEEINTLRKSISLVKGGGFADFVAPAQMWSFILSDIIGDPIESIASGPTVHAQIENSDLEEILTKYRLKDKLPQKVLEYLDKTYFDKNENIKIIQKVENFIIGNNALALSAVKNSVETHGYKAFILSDSIQGEAREIAKFWAGLINYQSKQKLNEEKLCFICGGETTVTLKGSGKGGRNQELVLAVLKELQDLDKPFYFCSFGTDGTDGPTDAAGAWINQQTFGLVKDKNLEVSKYLDNNDAYSFFDEINHLIKTGPTGTNVMDIMFCLL